jgi:hypothetical protein
MSETPPRRRWILAAVIAACVAALVAALVSTLLDRRPAESSKDAVAPAAGNAGAWPALPDLAGRILPVACRQGECVWLRVARVETVTATPRGELRRLTGRGGRSLYRDEAPEAYGASVPVRWEAEDRSSYAFCSAERPAYAFPDETGALVLHYLDLFDLGGYQMASARMYLLVCHDLPFDGEDAAPLRSLGYRPGTRSEQVEDAAPEDLARF